MVLRSGVLNRLLIAAIDTSLRPRSAHAHDRLSCRQPCLARAMAICKPAKAIKVRVSRQNSQRIGPSLTQHIRSVTRREGVHVQLPPPVAEAPGNASASTVRTVFFMTKGCFMTTLSPQENASEWNSLLVTARAGRGPYWDVSTQQFVFPLNAVCARSHNGLGSLSRKNQSFTTILHSY